MAPSASYLEKSLAPCTSHAGAAPFPLKATRAGLGPRTQGTQEAMTKKWAQPILGSLARPLTSLSSKALTPLPPRYPAEKPAPSSIAKLITAPTGSSCAGARLLRICSCGGPGDQGEFT